MRARDKCEELYEPAGARSAVGHNRESLAALGWNERREVESRRSRRTLHPSKNIDLQLKQAPARIGVRHFKDAVRFPIDLEEKVLVELTRKPSGVGLEPIE